jgi:hypothetical protein
LGRSPAGIPYLFLNPGMVGGYGVVALYCAAIPLATLLFTWLVVVTGRRVQLAVTPG